MLQSRVPRSASISEPLAPLAVPTSMPKLSKLAPRATPDNCMQLEGFNVGCGKKNIYRKRKGAADSFSPAWSCRVEIVSPRVAERREVLVVQKRHPGSCERCFFPKIFVFFLCPKNSRVPSPRSRKCGPQPQLMSGGEVSDRHRGRSFNPQGFDKLGLAPPGGFPWGAKGSPVANAPGQTGKPWGRPSCSVPNFRASCI